MTLRREVLDYLSGLLDDCFHGCRAIRVCGPLDVRQSHRLIR